jgi:hypothetical protein
MCLQAPFGAQNSSCVFGVLIDKVHCTKQLTVQPRALGLPKTTLEGRVLTANSAIIACESHVLILSK